MRLSDTVPGHEKNCDEILLSYRKLMQLCFVLLHALRQAEAMRVLCVWARASTSHTIRQVDDICSSSLLCSFLRMHGCVRARCETRNIAFHDDEVHNLVGGIIFHVGMFPYR